jgi:hypothetical protein
MRALRAYPSRTELAAAAARFDRSAVIHEGSEPYILLEASTPLQAEWFADQLGGLGQVVGELWYARGFEHVQAAVAMLWPWLGSQARARARAVLLGARVLAT